MDAGAAVHQLPPGLAGHPGDAPTGQLWRPGVPVGSADTPAGAALLSWLLCPGHHYTERAKMHPAQQVVTSDPLSKPYTSVLLLCLPALYLGKA